jgi:hypothetical protein
MCTMTHPQIERAKDIGRASGQMARIMRREPDGFAHWEAWTDRKEIHRAAGEQIYAIAREEFLVAFREGYAS